MARNGSKLSGFMSFTIVRARRATHGDIQLQISVLHSTPRSVYMCDFAELPDPSADKNVPAYVPNIGHLDGV